MPSNFYDLLKYAKTGISSPEMTHYDKMRALSMAGGGKIETLTGVPPLSFSANGNPLISWSLLGNGQQKGTPTPDNPIMPDFCGKLVGTDWTIPITCGGQTKTVYLGQTQTVRRVRKLVLPKEGWELQSINSHGIANFRILNILENINNDRSALCSHFYQTTVAIDYTTEPCFHISLTSPSLYIRMQATTASNASEFKSWLEQQYSAGTPVTIWYVLAEPETTIVNEPLCKIGNYADELHSEDAGVSIPTAKGKNTLTVETELQPSEITITYKK